MDYFHHQDIQTRTHQDDSNHQNRFDHDFHQNDQLFCKHNDDLYYFYKSYISTIQDQVVSYLIDFNLKNM